MTLYLNKFESPAPKNALCQVWLKLAQWFWRRFLNIFKIVLLFRYYLPLEKGVTFRLNKFESPPLKDALCLVWLKLARWFWMRRFLNIFNIILLFRYYLLFGKGVALHLNKFDSPLPMDALCLVWLKLTQWF